MRSRTVRSGLRMIFFGIVAVMVASFFPAPLSDLLQLGPGGQARLTIAGLLLGGMGGGFGVVVAVFGFLQNGAGGTRVPLAPIFWAIMLSMLAFFYLTYHSFTSVRTPDVRPGESIRI